MKVNDALIQRYTLRSTPHRTEKHTSPSHWDYMLCEILDNGVKVGEFIYNYHCPPPFHPFEQDGKHYALYSTHYTATRVMSLPDCVDIAGEDAEGFGFCPTGFAVPHFDYEVQEPPANDPEPGPNPRNDTAKWVQLTDKRWLRPGDEGYTLGYTKEEYEAAIAAHDEAYRTWGARNPYVTRPFNARFGFVCGCIWGDDTSWKIQYLDLSRISEGILTRDDRFGYIELMGGAEELKDAINTDFWEPDNPIITIASAHHYNTTKRVTSGDPT